MRSQNDRYCGADSVNKAFAVEYQGPAFGPIIHLKGQLQRCVSVKLALGRERQEDS